MAERRGIKTFGGAPPSPPKAPTSAAEERSPLKGDGGFQSRRARDKKFQVQVFLSPAIGEALDEMAAAHGTSRAAFVSGILEERALRWIAARADPRL